MIIIEVWYVYYLHHEHIYWVVLKKHLGDFANYKVLEGRNKGNNNLRARKASAWDPIFPIHHEGARFVSH